MNDLAATERFIGRYQITGELGRGAMGVVYRATDPQLARDVAIKTVDVHLDEDERKGYEARFLVEARAAGGLNHPNIVTIFDLGHSANGMYMAMELLDGRDLRDLLASTQPPGVASAVEIVRQVALGLGFAHQRHIVHRDIKPANIMLLAGGFAKVTDFGIARMRESSVHTQTGMRLGSPRYMSPEQVLGQRLDYRTDIFSLGIVLYELLLRRPPFDGESVEALMYQTINCVPVQPSEARPELPQMLDLIVARMLAKSPAERYADCNEIAADLAACAQRHDLAAIDADAVPLIASRAGPLRLAEGASAMVLARTMVGDRAGDSLAPELAATGLRVSRDFDSLAATQRLEAPSAVGDATVPYVPELPADGPAAAQRKPAVLVRHGTSAPSRREWIFIAVVLGASLLLAWKLATA